MRVGDVSTGHGLATLHGHRDAVTTVAFSPDGRGLASGSRDETINFWDMETEGRIKTLQSAGPYAGMKIRGITGITEAQKAALKALGAVE
jgi:WD40 repeat protein